MATRRRRQDKIELEVRAALAEFAASVEVRLHSEVARSQKTQVALIEAVQKLREETASRDVEFAQALTSLATMVEHFGATIEAEAHERRALVEAVGRLTQTLAGGVEPGARRDREPARERVLGGTVFGGQSDIEILSEGDALDDERRTAPAAQPKWAVADPGPVDVR